MNREQMIAWLTLEGWVACSGWDAIWRHSDKRFLLTCLDGTAAEGMYPSVYKARGMHYDVEWSARTDAQLTAFISYLEKRS